MKIKIRNKLLLALMTVFLCIGLLLCGLTINTSRKAYAAEIDYVNQNYTLLPSGFNVATEDVVYKIHCASIRSHFGEDEEIEDYVTQISFRASMGCQIYFVEGVACNLEDSSYGDYQTSKYINYYEVLHYDETNKYVYFKFKNLSQLDADETVDATLADLNIIHRDTTYLNAPQYIYLSNIEEPVTEVTPDDVFFASEVTAAHGGKGWTDYNIYSIEYTLKLNQKVSHLVDKIEISFVKGGEKFSLYESTFTTSDGLGENGYIEYDVLTLGDICGIAERVKLQAVVTYGFKTITVESVETDLITLWNGLVDSDFAGHDYETYMSATDKTHIKKLVESYNAGFYTEIKGSQNYFADYDKNTDIKLTSLIFKIPLTNFRNASFNWFTSYWQGYVYNVSVRIDSDLILTATAYKMKTNPDGTVTVAESTITYDDSVATQIYNSVDYFAYNDCLYVRIKDDSPISSYFPQNATRSFGASATDINSASITLQANTATIIYDEYNQELLAEIERLKAELAELQILYEEANALSESKIEEINSLKSSLDGLQVDYQNALDEIAYMNEQIEVMRQEYQKKIDQLISEKGDTQTPPEDNDSGEEPIEEEPDLKALLGVTAGIALLVVIIILVIPKRRR